MSNESKLETKEELIAKVKKEKKEGTKVVQEKEKKEQNSRSKVTPPPPPPVSLDGVVNPIVGSKGLKRALAVAICMECMVDGKVDEVKAASAIRKSGILYKAGYEENNKTDELTDSEWSGLPYARFCTNTADGQIYPKKHPEKIEKCKLFAKALVTSVTFDV